MTGGSPIKGDAVANPIDSRNATDEREWISATVGASGFRADVQAGPHACMAMTLRMYADRKKWPLEGVTIYLRTDNAHQKDCERCETAEVGPPRIARRIEFTGPLTDEQRTRLLQIADRCPVKQTLERGLKVEPVSQ